MLNPQVTHFGEILKLLPWASGALYSECTVVANTAGQWHALIYYYGQHSDTF